MPEGPEYKKMERLLDQKWVGRRILEIVPVDSKRDTKYIKLQTWEGFKLAVLGRQVVSIETYGKNLLINLEGDEVWWVHFSSTGWFYPAKGKGTDIAEHFLHPTDEKTTRLVIGLDDGSVWHYRDSRTWGKFYVGWKLGVRNSLLRYGPDWLKTPSAAMKALLELSSKRKVKDILTDQTITAGIGNYLACEILFEAGIDPARRWHELDKERKQRLLLACGKVLALAVESENHEHWQVFKRLGEPCKRCAAPIRRLADTTKRGSYYCGRCQT